MTEGTEMTLHQPPLLVKIEGKTDKDSGPPKTGSQNEIITVAVIPSKDKERNEQQSLRWLADMSGPGVKCSPRLQGDHGIVCCRLTPSTGHTTTLWPRGQLLILPKGVL